MKIRKMGLCFAPKNRELKIDVKYSIDEVCDLLTRYLNDEIELTSDLDQDESGEDPLRKCPKRKKKKVDKQAVTPYDGLNEMQAIMLSNAIIGTRIILKYCKGEKPHWMRVKIWLKGLRIADYLEEIGQLKTKRICFFVRKGYLFCCRVYYDIDGIGTVVLPESKACKFSHWVPILDGSNDTPGPFLAMPPLMSNTDGTLKKEAAKLITEYNLE